MVADCLVEFIMECSPSNVEFCKRMHVVDALLKIWKDDAKQPLTEALDSVLDPEKQMNTIPGRNITYFIRCLVEEKYIDPNELRIKTNSACSLSEKDSNRLQQKLFKRYHTSGSLMPRW